MFSMSIFVNNYLNPSNPTYTGKENFLLICKMLAHKAHSKNWVTNTGDTAIQLIFNWVRYVSYTRE